ncbi:MAG TPA: hypothetical protein VN445_06045 [Rectinemataceae bacterium]|nr:hypothetical protein [Rectinemataceae bacterium]
MLRRMIADAVAGKPVYISRAHSCFASLPTEQSDRMVLFIRLLDSDGEKAWELKLPKLERCSGQEKIFVREYIHAEIYNILSGLGARSMTVFVDPAAGELVDLAKNLNAAFCVDEPRGQRSGYGRAVNVLDRMMTAVHPGEPAFRFDLRPLSLLPAIEPPRAADAPAASAARPQTLPAPLAAPPTRLGAADSRESGDSLSAFRRCTVGLEGKAFCGMDIGGTDIKAVLVDDGKVIDYKEYDWFPASFLRSRQLVDPILLLIRLLRDRLWIHRAPVTAGRRKELLDRIAAAMDKKASDETMTRILDTLEAEGSGEESGERPGGFGEGGRLDSRSLFDGIGLCFPDVVVRNKIVGGEVYKTRGIRNNPDLDYESDFAELTELDARLKASVKPEGTVRIINDGPMASFAAAVEIAAFPETTASGNADASPKADEVANGVFAHTLGTELGTGWVTETGSIPDIPLEVYNFIIDLGSWPERAHEPDDLRSVNNFNTGLPGTLQKYCSQSGVFRLAMKYFPAERPDLFRELQAKGYIVRRATGGAASGRVPGGASGEAVDGATGDSMGWYVPTDPVDQRKPFLEHMMKLPDREKDETNRKIWREIGEFLAVTLLETKRVLDPGTDKRFLFGRLVKNRTCFDLMAEGGRGIIPDISLIVAGTGMANTPLMKELERHPELTVAQFAQAIGAVYFANSR